MLFQAAMILQAAGCALTLIVWLFSFFSHGEAFFFVFDAVFFTLPVLANLYLVAANGYLHMHFCTLVALQTLLIYLVSTQSG